MQVGEMEEQKWTTAVDNARLEMQDQQSQGARSENAKTKSTNNRLKMHW